MSQTLEEKAKRLLAQGYSKTEVADRCGVSRRTIIRWSKRPDFISAIKNGVKKEELIERADTEVATVAVSVIDIEQRINDLLTYRDGQRQLAQNAEKIASELFPVCQAIITELQQNPSENISSARLLTQLIKGFSEASKVSSDCWARATGIEGRIRNDVREEFNARRTGLHMLLDTVGHEKIEKLLRRCYPIKPGESGEEILTSSEKYFRDLTM